ncbi:MAG: hypothetical protein JXA66_06470, partial [Oligoflexia bacterium]|nr:hypothetical protein [Oligoflexia bacterium]
LPEEVYIIVFQHHERISGEGFPQGLKKQGFHLLAQIVALANEMDHFLADKIITSEQIAKELSKQLVIDFLGKHELKLIKKISGIVSELANEMSKMKDSPDSGKNG